ncbi:MAG: SIMPL domain-containing protein, partial [Flavobacteriaceae bacterium]|nr:SIMPL domain-containing protein [Flavobacteriaceae bacterium]
GEISLNGTAETWVTPDQTGIDIRLQELHPDLSSAISALNKQVARLQDELAKAGIDKSSIKTSVLNTSKQREYDGNKKKYIDKGYLAQQQLQVEFLASSRKLESVLNRFNRIDFDFNFSVYFKLSDALRQNINDQLLVDAVKNAKHRAKIATEAMGVKLGAIKKLIVDKDINPQVSNYGYMKSAALNDAESNYVPPVEAKEQSLSHRVQVIFFLEQ